MSKSKKYVLVGVIAVALLSVSDTALASNHFAIIADFLNSKNDPVYFDVGTPLPGTKVRYTVYQAAGDRIETVVFNNNVPNFATSSDLFNLGGSPVVLPALVQAETVDGSGFEPDFALSFAVLRQNKLILDVPSTTRGTLGCTFLITLADVGRGAHLLVANPNGGIASGSYFVNGGVRTFFAVEPNLVKDIPLTSAPAIITISNTTAKLVVGLAIEGKGQDFALTLIRTADADACR